MNLISRIDMNRQESHLNGIVFTVAYLPKYDKFTLVTMDNNIPLVVFNFNEPGNVLKVVKGENIGTTVRGK